MQITLEFKHILEYVLAQEERKENIFERRTKAIAVLANEAALKAIAALPDNSDVEIQNFFFELEALGEIGEHHVAVEILSRLFEVAGLREMGYLIDGFIAGNRWEDAFLEELVEFGSDHCFFRSIGLEY